MADLDHERLRQAIEAGAPLVDDARLARQRRALLAAAPPRRPRQAWRLGFAMAMAGLVAVVWGLRPAPPPSAGRLDYFVAESTSPGVPGEPIVAVDATPITFAGGSRLALAAGSRAVVERHEGSAVRVRLETGAVDVVVRRGETASFTLVAGENVVVLNDSRTSVRWGPEGALDVVVAEGQAQVQAPGRAAPFVVLGGETLRANAVAGTWEVTRRAVEAPGPAAVAPVAPAVPVVAEAGGPLSRAPRPSMPAWRAAGVEGPRLLALVRTDGPARVIAQMTAQELLTLADAARFERDAQVAREALLALRTRFPRSTQAGRAAFLLGRVEAELALDLRAATRWFERSVTEAPDGPLAEESLGRQLECLVRLDDPAKATVAASYLRRYPEGPFAGLAALARGPPKEVP